MLLMLASGNLARSACTKALARLLFWLDAVSALFPCDTTPISTCAWSGLTEIVASPCTRRKGWALRCRICWAWTAPLKIKKTPAASAVKPRDGNLDMPPVCRATWLLTTALPPGGISKWRYRRCDLG